MSVCFLSFCSKQNFVRNFDRHGRNLCSIVLRTLYAESTPRKADYHPFNLEVGQLQRFHGVFCKHGTVHVSFLNVFSTHLRIAFDTFLCFGIAQSYTWNMLYLGTQYVDEVKILENNYHWKLITTVLKFSFFLTPRFFKHLSKFILKSCIFVDFWRGSKENGKLSLSTFKNSCTFRDPLRRSEKNGKFTKHTKFYDYLHWRFFKTFSLKKWSKYFRNFLRHQSCDIISFYRFCLKIYLHVSEDWFDNCSVFIFCFFWEYKCFFFWEYKWFDKGKFRLSGLTSGMLWHRLGVALAGQAEEIHARNEILRGSQKTNFKSWLKRT